MSNVWFTSDLHIGHVTVAETRGFLDDAEVHDAMLAANWDKHVGRDDTVWVLGDISAGGNRSQRRALAWLRERPGIKHLIAGNHDGCHPMHRNAHRWQPEYLTGPDRTIPPSFVSVHAFARRRIGGRPVLLSHFPYVGDHTTEDRFNQYRLRDRGEILLHGHTHSREKTSRGKTRGQGIPGVVPWPGPLQVHVGVDAWDLRPVSLDEVAELIAREDVS